MKKIKFLLFAAMAVMAFAACSKDDDNSSSSEIIVSNIVSEYSYNDSLVAATKAKSGNTKAVLLIAFGSTWTNAFDAFDNTVKAYQSAFPGYDVYLSYSSDICINRAAAAEHGVERNYYEPRYLLHAIGASKYSEIRVQSLQVIPGEEFSNVVAAVKKFMNNGYISTAHLDDDYLKKLNDNEAIYFGMPLLYDADTDVPTVAKNLDGVFSSYAKDGIVAFMGHGNPDTYDTFKANVRYTQLEEALQKINPNYFVGTVDMSENYKMNVWDRIQASSTATKNKTITFQALMSIAGDHAHNDMIGGSDGNEADYWDADEPGSEDNSWYEYFKNIGKYTTENTTISGNKEPIGLLEIPSILNVWINHTKNAQPFEDAYHSMYPEE